LKKGAVSALEGSNVDAKVDKGEVGKNETNTQDVLCISFNFNLGERGGGVVITVRSKQYAVLFLGFVKSIAQGQRGQQ